MFICIYACVSYVPCLKRTGEGTGSPGTEDTDDCKTPWRCWQLKEQKALLSTKPSLQPLMALTDEVSLGGESDRRVGNLLELEGRVGSLLEVGVP